jgi:solute carrier family 39 (zinc transporter), member 1/2/3
MMLLEARGGLLASHSLLPTVGSFVNTIVPLKRSNLGLSHQTSDISIRKSLSTGMLLRGGNTQMSNFFPLSLSASKVGLQFALTLLNVFCWAVPLRNQRLTQNDQLLSLANAFAGGIFLMLSFSHLLPEAMEILASASTSANTKGSSGIISFFTKANGSNVLWFSLVGFMSMLFVEKVAFISTHSEEQKPLPLAPISVNEQSLPPRFVQSSFVAQTVSSGASGGGKSSALALCGAMSVHSFFEAVALGLAPDMTSSYMMAACIALHQPAESIALLVAFLKSGLPVRTIVLCLSAFSLVALAGVTTGVMVSSVVSSSVEALLMAFTAGTFIFVGATEVRLMFALFYETYCTVHGCCEFFLFS